MTSTNTQSRLVVKPEQIQGLNLSSSAQRLFHPVPFWESVKSNNRTETSPRLISHRHIQHCENEFARFCKEAIGPVDKSLSIPQRIHLIWLGSTPPPEVLELKDHWRQKCRDWEIKLWTDEEVAKEHARCPFANFEKLKDCSMVAERSDIIRYELLFRFGGLYVDTDVACLRSFEPLHMNGVSFYAALETNERFYLGTAIIGSCPGHPILREAVTCAMSERERPDLWILDRSGPQYFTNCVERTLDTMTEKKGILILPCSYFYPLPWFEGVKHLSLSQKRSEIRPESIAIHYWNGTWMSWM